jgi:acyl-coenzyme A thioesterase PaaI-like protein
MKYKALNSALDKPERFHERLEHLKSIHHSECVFNRNPPVPSLQFRFKEGGILTGEFTGTEAHQGYKNMVHGGILAAMIDASMAQCLMGHGVAAYTTDLNLKFRKPVLINRQAIVETTIEEVDIGMLYSLTSVIIQNRQVSVKASGRFLKIE